MVSLFFCFQRPIKYICHLMHTENKKRQAILKAMAEKILILDGALGTLIQTYDLCEEDFRSPVKGNNDILNITRPDVLEDIHRRYVDAGVDILTTNTFSSNVISQKEYGCQDLAAEMARAGASIARKVADAAPRQVFVAGSIGPTGKSLTLATELDDPAYRMYSFDDMSAAYRTQIEALIDGGADMILFETCFDALNVKAGIYALRQLERERPELKGFPVMVSMSASDRSGRSLTGQTVEAFFYSVRHADLISFGLNCSLGAEDLAPLMAGMTEWADCPLSCHPNAGLPDEMGAYTQTPEMMAAQMRKLAQKGLNIAGGCCGTTPEHIKAVAAAVADIAPRPMPERCDHLCVSGLDPVHVDLLRRNFTNVGERTNVAGSRKFAKLIAAGDYDTALNIAAAQIDGGANIIDINMDDAMLDSTAQMRIFLRHIANDPAVSRAAVMIDSSHWETVAEGLRNVQGKSIVNSISLKEGEDAFLRKAREIADLGGAMVVMAFDEQGQATVYERKIEICKRAYDLLTAAGIPSTDIVFDVNVLSIGTGIDEHRRYAIDFIEAVRWIKTNLPGSLTSGGVSNLSFAFRGNNPVREAMHSIFLYHAIKAGLDMAIVNPGMLQVYDDIDPKLLGYIEDVIFDRSDEATGALVELASEMLERAAAEKEGRAVAKPVETAPLNVAERLSNALVKGVSVNLEADVMQCLEECGGKAVDVIEGPLMAGMEKVGELFGAGRMFLPQVVKSARIMRDAVAVLEPYMGSDESGSVQRPKIVIATVKGDVHDIGKNITAIVLRCNGFEVRDLGVMVDKETIIETALEWGADIIAVSGLITPSLFQMEEICRDLSARGLDIPLFIGGATTSPLHTAVKLAPLYDHVFYAPDASASAVMAKRCLSDRQAFESAEHARQEEIRGLYARGKDIDAEAKSVAEYDESAFMPYGEGETFAADMPLREYSVAELMPEFDWRMFFQIWGIKAADQDSEQALSLKSDAVRMLEHIKIHRDCRVVAAMHFEPVLRQDDDSLLLVRTGKIIPMMRKNRSMADFVSKKTPSAVGFFAVCADEVPEFTCDCCGPRIKAERGEYEELLRRSVLNTLAEAASCKLDRFIAAGLALEGRKIIKPAAGYYSLPDHSLKIDIMEMIPGSDKLGIKLTESYGMIPDASICGMVMIHEAAEYLDLRNLDAAVVNAYAEQRGMDETMKNRLLSHLIKA